MGFDEFLGGELSSARRPYRQNLLTVCLGFARKRRRAYAGVHDHDERVQSHERLHPDHCRSAAAVFPSWALPPPSAAELPNARHTSCPPIPHASPPLLSPLCTCCHDGGGAGRGRHCGCPLRQLRGVKRAAGEGPWLGLARHATRTRLVRCAHPSWEAFLASPHSLLSFSFFICSSSLPLTCVDACLLCWRSCFRRGDCPI